MLWSFDEGWVHLPVPKSARKIASGTLPNSTVSGSTSTVSGLKCNFKMMTSTSYRRLALLLSYKVSEAPWWSQALVAVTCMVSRSAFARHFGAFRPRSGEFRHHRRIAALCFPIQFGSRFAWRPPSVFVTEEWQDPMARTMGLTQPTIRL